MDVKIGKIVGIEKKAFDDLVTSKKIALREARLIPFSKPGDELSLASVLLSSFKLIKEFKKAVLSEVKMSTAGKMHIYTEVCFANFKDCRPDGLILIERGGVIVDAALLELKCGAKELELDQIEKYTALAKELNIPRIITVSNQFVSESTQNPLHLKSTKYFNYYHLSWSYLLTIGHILLSAKEENGIGDEDQKEIMKEVLNYFEADNSGICGFNQMKKGWSEVVDKIHTGICLKLDESTKDAVLSWQQEEMDIALMLSRSLGVIVGSGESKYRTDLAKRIEDDCKKLISTNTLNSVLKIKGAVSPITINAHFQKRAIEMTISMKAPFDKKSKGQIGWLEKQLKVCRTKREAKFNEIQDGLRVDIYFKNTSKPERLRYSDFIESSEMYKDKEIREFEVIFYKDLGKEFASRTKFVSSIESMVTDFYNTIVEHMRNYEIVAPKMKEEVIVSENTQVQASEVSVSEAIVEELPQEADTSSDESAA